MSSLLRFLVVEDEEPWQKVVQRALEEIGGAVKVDVAASLETARDLIERRHYDLATVDLALLGPARLARDVDELGLALIEKLLGGERTNHVGVLVLTAHFTPDRVRKALVRYHVQDVIDKAEFTMEAFLAAVRAALLTVRLARAGQRAAKRHQLTVFFSETSWLGCQLRVPQRHVTSYVAEKPAPLDVKGLAGRADEIDRLVSNESPAERGILWRPEARSIGRAMFQAFQADRRIFADFERARDLAGPHDPLWLQLSGPAAGLGLPIELMRNESDLFCFECAMAREVSGTESRAVRKGDPFHVFLADLNQRGETLRVLLVAPEGGLPAAQQEIATLREEISLELRRLGLRFEVRTMSGAEVSREALREALDDGPQIFHYAGHGRFDSDLPEASGLVLGNQESLTAADLKLLVERSELRVVFLSSCLGARTAETAGRGDFKGTLHALAQAGAPTALGYRWTVSDQSAFELATSFYSALWSSLSPEQALLEARRTSSMNAAGRDDETWASPLLLSQTG
jgi:CheY-like chemotaxis protein